MLPTNPETAADIAAIEALLEAAPIGGVVGWAAMSQAIGRDILARRWLYLRARDNVEKRTGGIFETVRDAGLKRLETASIPDIGRAALRKVRRTARRAVSRIQRVRVNDLPQTDAQRIVAYQSQLGAIALIADARKTPAIVAKLAPDSAVVPAGRVLELFRA